MVEKQQCNFSGNLYCTTADYAVVTAAVHTENNTEKEPISTSTRLLSQLSTSYLLSPLLFTLCYHSGAMDFLGVWVKEPSPLCVYTEFRHSSGHKEGTDLETFHEKKLRLLWVCKVKFVA